MAPLHPPPRSRLGLGHKVHVWSGGPVRCCPLLWRRAYGSATSEADGTFAITLDIPAEALSGTDYLVNAWCTSLLEANEEGTDFTPESRAAATLQFSPIEVLGLPPTTATTETPPTTTYWQCACVDVSPRYTG